MPDTPDTSAPAAAPGIDVNALLQQLLGGGATPPPPQVQNVNLAATRPTSLGGILGEALAGGPPTDVPLTAAQRDAAGRRALLSASIGMMNVGPFASIGQGIGAGLSGAMASQAYSEAVEAERQTAAQDWQTKQQQLQLERLKEAIPLLRMQAAAGIPNPLLGGNAPPGAVPPTASVGATSNAADFTAKFTPIAQTIANKTGLPLSYVLSQAGLETGWGSSPAARNNNFFGMTDPATGKLMSFATPEEGANAYIALMASDRYKGVPRTGTPQQIGDAMALAGYNPNVPKKDSTDSYGARIGAFAGSLPKPGTTVAAAAPPGASTGPPGQPPVQVGGAAPPPPGAPAGAGTTYPTVGAGIGRVLAGTVGKAGPDQYTVTPPPVVKASPIPAGKLLGGDVGAMVRGMQLADTTLPPGTVAAAGPAAGTPPPQATTPTPEAGWGAKIGYGAYDSGAAKAPVTPAPAVATTTPTAPPTPQVTTQATQPPTPPGRLTFEQFQAQHPITINPADYTVTTPGLAEAKAAQAAAAQQLSLARAGISGDPNKSLSDYNTATQTVNKLQQDAQQQSLELQQKARQNAIDTQRQLYNDEMQRQQQVEENEKNRQAQIGLETQKGQQAIELAKIQAGQTFHQKLQEQSAQTAQENTLKPMGEQAMKAHQMNLGLAQMQPLLADLPPSGGALGTVLDANPDLAPLFNVAGILNDKQADAVRLINGLVANISTQMKPTGLGALREYEWDAFKAQLPSMLGTAKGNAKAIALLMNMNDRIQSENSWMNNYYNRQIPDETSTTGATRPAHNLDGQGSQSVQQMMDKDLGPIVPKYQGPVNDKAIADWVSTLPPGKPYYRPYAVRDPKNPSQPLRDSNGNVRTTTGFEFVPW